MLLPPPKKFLEKVVDEKNILEYIHRSKITSEVHDRMSRKYWLKYFGNHSTSIYEVKYGYNILRESLTNFVRWDSVGMVDDGDLKSLGLWS